MARAAMLAVMCTAVAAIIAPVAAQHEHHGTPVKLDTLRANAERSAIQLRSGATIVDARASAAAAGGSVADLLRTIPGVDLDADGRISMRGSTSVLLLMNGRRSALSGEALVAFLRQMPAAALERIEAGTTTSAQQSADGIGVVNLVFRDETAPRTALRSVAGSIASDDHYMGSAAVTGNAGQVLSWDAMYSVSGMRPRTESQTARWSLVPGDLPLQTDQDNHAREKHLLHAIAAGVTGSPSSKTSLGIRGSYSWMEGANRNRSDFVYTNAEGYTGTSATSSRIEHVIPSGELSAVAQMNLASVRFTSEARGSFVDEDARADYYDEVAGYRYISTVMDTRQREVGVRNAVTMRLAGIRLDVGQESQLRTITTAHDATHFDATLSQDYRYELDVHAGYFNMERSVGAMRAEAGLRVEADRTRIEFADASTRTAIRFFPSIRGEWTDVRHAAVYRIAYGRRIHRPGAQMLNPFSMGDYDMNEIVGNPLLLPEISDQLELGMEQQSARFTWQLTPFLRWTRDPIRQLKASTARGGTLATLTNLNRARATGADASVRARATDHTVVTLAGSVAHSQTKADDLGSSGVYATARLTVDVRVAENTTAQLYAYRRSTKAIEQGEILPAFTTEFALVQRLAGERGRVTLRLNDPLRSDRVELRIADATFTEQSRQRTARPLLSLFASYAVGGAPREDAPF
jgi:outer membrane cobalamin receptor